ncbi:MAG: hypothetical protein AB1304_00290 [Bacteroidota bacterium]
MKNFKKEGPRFIEINENNRIRIELSITKPLNQKWQLEEILIQYETKVDNEWKEVVRYDNAHNFFHRDFIMPNGKKRKKKLKVFTNLQEALQFARKDLMKNWAEYRMKWIKYYEKYKK